MVFKLGNKVHKFSLGDTDDCYYSSSQDQVIGLDSKKTYWHDNEGYYSQSFEVNFSQIWCLLSIIAKVILVF